MKMLELREKLNEKKVPSDMYSLDGWTPFEKMCIEKKRGEWHVYCSEKGSKHGLKIFKREDDACEYFYKCVMWDFNAYLEWKNKQCD